MIPGKLPDFSATRVVVVGDVMLDRYWHGVTSRISPEAPVPVVRVKSTEDRPGGAANVALNLAALGVRPILIGLTGDDESAHFLEHHLTTAGVECRFKRVSGVPTVTKMRATSRNQQLIRLDFEESFPSEAADAIVEMVAKAIDEISVVICSDYAKGCLRSISKIIHLARRADKRVLIDPKGVSFGKYAGASLITPNLAEFEGVVGNVRDTASMLSRGIELIKSLGLEALLVTRGEFGMVLLRESSPELDLPARAREVYDVTGAGDTVIAVLGAALAAGESLPIATALANLAGGCVVSKLGTAVVTPTELRRALSIERGSNGGVVDHDELLIAVKDAWVRNERIVMTNGSFDILHSGHVEFLRAAKRLGDRLIVAVSDDESVRRLKGQGRPVNTLHRRMAVLAALESVDWVIPFSEDTPASLINRVKPDILVKGGDYKPEDIVGSESVWASGGQVRVLAYEKGVSTTALLNRIRAQRGEDIV